MRGMLDYVGMGGEFGGLETGLAAVSVIGADIQDYGSNFGLVVDHYINIYEY